jgi:hypothetical protein
MLTIDQLCAEMERSGHHLTPRAARDWWTKGLLPRPRRRGLGRGKGTLTFWTNPRILDQAQAADELLGRHSRTYTAIIGLWLWGFPVDPKLVRSSYLKLIDRYHRPRDQLEDWIAELAPKIARRVTEPRTQRPVREKLTDAIIEFLNAFFGIQDIEINGIAENWAAAVPYMRPNDQKWPVFIDEDFGWFINHLR